MKFDYFQLDNIIPYKSNQQGLKPEFHWLQRSTNTYKNDQKTSKSQKIRAGIGPSLARDASPQSEWLDQESGAQTKLKIPQKELVFGKRSPCYSETPLLIIMFTIQISITWDKFSAYFGEKTIHMDPAYHLVPRHPSFA